MPASKPASLLKFTAPLLLALALVACSDSEQPAAAERTIAAPLPDVIANAGATGIKPPPIPAPPQVQAKGYILLDYVSANFNDSMPPPHLPLLFHRLLLLSLQCCQQRVPALVLPLEVRLLRRLQRML